DLSLQPTSASRAHAATNPPPEGWGSFTSAYISEPGTRRNKSPNRQVGDLSLQPTTASRAHAATNPPTGRLGIFHSSLQQRAGHTPQQIPQPAGWGSFTPAYNSEPGTRRNKSPNRMVGDLSLQPTSATRAHAATNPPTGRLGIFHSSLHQRPGHTPQQIPQPAGWGSFTP